MILRAVRKIDFVFGIDRDRIPRESLSSRGRITKCLTSIGGRLKSEDVSRLIVYFVLSKKSKISKEFLPKINDQINKEQNKNAKI